VLRAGAPELTITAHCDLSLTEAGQTVELTAQSSNARSVEEPLVVEARTGEAALLSIDVRPGTSVGSLQADLREAEEQLATALREAGAASVEAAEADAEARTVAQQDRERAEPDLEDALGDQTREDLLSRKDSLAAEVAMLQDQWGSPGHELTVED